MKTSTTNLRYKAVIFDLDGTLVDSLVDLASSMNRVLLEKNLPIHPIAAYKKFVGNGMKKLVERALPTYEREKVDIYLERLLTIYADQCILETRPYAGIQSLLKNLTEIGIPACIVTNKKEDLTDKIVKHFFKDYFVEVIGDRFDGKRKPDPTYPLFCAERLGLATSEILFIGDSDVDIQTGINAAMDTCGVLWGFRTEQELKSAGATWIVSSPKEILTIVKKD